jgi:hypothetical protein
MSGRLWPLLSTFAVACAVAIISGDLLPAIAFALLALLTVAWSILRARQ